MAARDEDDLAAAAPLDHVAGHELGHVEPAGERPVDHPGERLGVVLEEVGAAVERRVAHQDVDAPQGLDRPRHHLLAGWTPEDVPFDQGRPPAHGPDLGGRGLGLRGALAIVDRDVRPGPGQFEGDAPSDPPRRARHQCRLALEFHPLRGPVGIAAVRPRPVRYMR